MRMFEDGPDGFPDPTKPSRVKVHGLSLREPSFPRPLRLRSKRGSGLYDFAEVRDWLRSRPRGGASLSESAKEPSAKRRGRPAKAKIGGTE